MPANPAQDRGTTMFNNHSARGELFEGWTGPVSLSIGTGVLRVVVANPSNSGRNVLITNARVGNAVSTIQTVTLTFNPTTVPGSSSTPWTRLVGGTTASQATFKFESATSGLSGGTTGPVYLVYGSGLTCILDDYGPLVLTPGNSIGLATSAFGLTANAECIMNWIEVSV